MRSADRHAHRLAASSLIQEYSAAIRRGGLFEPQCPRAVQLAVQTPCGISVALATTVDQHAEAEYPVLIIVVSVVAALPQAGSQALEGVLTIEIDQDPDGLLRARPLSQNIPGVAIVAGAID